MFRRFAVGALKGLVIGAVLGVSFHVGLGWTTAPSLLGVLIAMGTGATAGILAGVPPWRQEAFVESVLKSVVGMALAGVALWAARHYFVRPFPIALPNVPATAPWTDVPAIFCPLVAALFGAIVELDNDRRREAI